MPHYRYLILGGGMSADAAVRGIRELDADSPIGILSAEQDPPYKRPPLSKALWKGEPLESAWLDTPAFGVEMHLGHRAKALDLRARKVVDERGAEFGYDKLLLATGGTPRRLPFGGDHVIYFRTMEDYRILRALADAKRTFAVIGGGFIGSEIAAALAMQECQVTLLFPEEGISARLFPKDLSGFLAEYYASHGVDVRAKSSVTGIREEGSRLAVQTANGGEVLVDAVVAGVGIVPDTELAETAGLKVENGILVDEHLCTSHPDVFACGDVARFHAPSLGKHMRVEHEDNALTMGRAAGRAMAGDDAPYAHLPFFYSDLFDLGYEAVGEMNPAHQVVADWKEPFREGVVYYLSNGRVRGVLLWNTWGQVDAARALIAEPGPFREADLQGRLPAG